MKQLNPLTLALVVLVCGTGSFVSAQETPPLDKQAVVRQARQDYYNLRTLGLLEFQAGIQPNWEFILKEQVAKDPEAAQAGLKLLNRLHFTLIFDSQGKVTVNHTEEVAPPNERVAAGFQQIYGGMSKALSGFFTIWNLFMFDSPLPQVNDTYQMQDVDGQYRLSYNDGDADVITMLNRDREITEISVSAPGFKSSLKPRFTKTSKGYVLVGYKANYLPTTGSGVTSVVIQFDDEEVDGFRLPHKLQFDTTLDGTRYQLELLLSGYQVKKRW